MDIAWDGSKFVVVGANSANAFTVNSSDGITWNATNALVLGVPNAPSNLANTITSTSITVSFTAPVQVISSYTIVATPTSGSTVTNTGISAATTSYTITGLQTAMQYVITVTAINNYGTSLPATITSQTAVAPPSGLSAVSNTATSLVLSFVAPTVPSGITVTGYTATLVPTSGTTITQSGITSSPVTITGLQASMTYTITLVSNTAYGSSSPSTALTYSTIGFVATVNTASLNVANLVQTTGSAGLATLNINPAGTQLFYTSSSSSPNGRVIYNVNFANNSYATTQYCSSIAGGGYGDINYIAVTNTRIYPVGGFTSINGDTNVNTIAQATIGTPGFTTYLKTAYSARYISAGVFDNSNVVYLTAVNFRTGPSDGYFNGGCGLVFEPGASSRLSSINGFGTNVSLGPGNTYRTVGNFASPGCFDPSYNNIYYINQCNGPSPPFTSAGNYNYVNCISVFNVATNSTSVLTIFTYNNSSAYSGGTIYRSLAISSIFAYFTVPNATTFNDTNSVACNYIAQVSIGATPTIYSMSTGLNGLPWSIVFDQKRGILYVAGAFTTAGGISVGYTACWVESQNTWGKLVTLNGICRSMVMSPTYDILFFAGDFTTINGVSCNGFASVTLV
jgi:hypothetical protein